MMCIKCYEEAVNAEQNAAATDTPPRAPFPIDPSLITQADVVSNGESLCAYHLQSKHPSGSSVITSGRVA